MLIAQTNSQQLLAFLFRAFDVELLYIGQQLGMPMKEVAVNWEEIEGEINIPPGE